LDDYLEAGVDCVFPILLWEMDPLRRFIWEVPGTRPALPARLASGLRTPAD
jgi:2-methylisocitrate lyase-like PEP mutase family enzyme